MYAFEHGLRAGEERQRELIIIYHVPDGSNARMRMVVLWTLQDHQQSAKDKKKKKKD